jgi:hypothetical protein
MAEGSTRRFNRKKFTSRETVPALRVIRSINKYGSNIWNPAAEGTEVTTRRGEIKMTAELRSVPDASFIESNNTVTKGSVLGEHSLSNSDGGVDGKNVRIEASTVRDKDNMYESSIQSPCKCSRENNSNKHMKMHDADGKLDNQPSLNCDVDMGDFVITTEDATEEVPDSEDGNC